jgi:hypothetical protein
MQQKAQGIEPYRHPTRGDGSGPFAILTKSLIALSRA